MTSKIDKYIVGQFQNPINPKDGFAMEECEDTQGKAILDFLILILYPKKPIQFTMAVGNTIFGALMGDRPIDWGLMLLVGRLAESVGKGKATPIYPYMFHLYKEQ